MKTNNKYLLKDLCFSRFVNKRFLFQRDQIINTKESIITLLEKKFGKKWNEILKIKYKESKND